MELREFIKNRIKVEKRWAKFWLGEWERTDSETDRGIYSKALDRRLYLELLLEDFDERSKCVDGWATLKK